MITYVSYLRQSTIKQQVSRLGVDAQREIIKSYLGDTSLILREYVETESGKKNNRPHYLKRLNYASVLIRSLSVPSWIAFQEMWHLPVVCWRAMWKLYFVIFPKLTAFCFT